MDAFWSGEWCRSRDMGVLDGVVIVEGEVAVLGVNVRRRIVTNGDILS